MRKKFIFIALLVTLFSANSSWAQVAPQLPGSVNPGQVSRALKQQQPHAAGSQVLAPVQTKESPSEKALSEQVKKIKFKLNKITLTGNHVYSTRELSLIYKDFIGKTISVADLFGIVQSITNYYRNNGYILSRAVLPPQHVKEGNVQIQIIEGYINKVSVSGNPRGSKCLVQKIGSKITEKRPLQITNMERYMLLENQIPGTTVKAVLAPDATEPGAADITLVTDTKVFGGYFSYDNYGTRYLGPQQMTGNVQGNSLWMAGDSSQVTFVKTPMGQELTYLDGNYNFPVTAEGIRWLVGGTRVKTHPLFILRPVDINGINKNYYTTVYFPIILTRSENLTLRAGFNYLDSSVTSLGILRLYLDSIRSLDLGGTYNFADSYGGYNAISADVRQGLPIWGYSSNFSIPTATTSRPGGHAVYTKIIANVSRTQAIKGPFSVYGTVQGQHAFSALLAEEQFTFGGPIIGRGYDVAEFIGDQGFAGSLELRFDHSFEKYVQNIQLYLFYDGGIVWDYYFVGGVPTKQSGTSTGVGMRFNMTQYISGNVMWTQVLTTKVAAEEFIGRGKAPRVFFSLVASV